MQNLYEILRSNPQSSTEELRNEYKRLVRLHHPDKNVQTTSSTDDDKTLTFYKISDVKRGNVSEAFISIDKAWKILSNPDLRAEYDAKWHEHALAQDLPIQDYVLFEDFDHEELNAYTYVCRCGGKYVLSEIDSQVHFDVVCCDTCSLTIKVVYDDVH
jgi:diphthamide biosynthesis protein 4